MDSTRVKALLAAASNANANYVPDVTPPSANAASLGKYGDTPVSYYVGLPNTSINLYTIQSKDLSLPISLSYHHGGIKVEEEASNVGLGFSMNQGGVITRTIFGLDDLRSKGIPFHQIPAVPETDPYFKNNVSDPLWGTPGVDTQLDIFYFNVGGISGKFILAAGSTFPLKGIPLDKSDVSITCKLISSVANPPPPTWGGSPQYQWEIITAEGIKYTFTQQEIAVSMSGFSPTLSPQFYFNNPANLPTFEYNSVRSGHQITAWYLTEVYSLNTLNTITLNYDNDAPYYSTSRMTANEVYQKGFLENQGPGCISPATLMNKNSGFSYHVTMTRNAYLKSIVYDNGKVDFTLSDREDLQQYFPSGNGALTFPTTIPTGDIDDVSSYAGTAKKPQKIQTIAVKDAAGTLLKKFEFTYSYFNSSVVGTLPTNPSFTDNMLKYNNLRLRLDQVQETDNLGTSYLPAHQFRYVGDIFDSNGTLTSAVILPAKTSWAKDYYGYYNGKNANNTSVYSHIIPLLAYPKMIGDKTFSGAYKFTKIGYGNTFSIGIDREVDSTYEAYGALSQIYYPTGGYSNFDYGFHKAMGGAGDVEVSVFYADANNNLPPPLVVPTGENNLYVTDIEFRLDCSSFTPVPSTECKTSNAAEDFSNTWYAKIQSFGNVFRSRNYSDWANKLCTTQGNVQMCTYVFSETNVPVPTGTHQLSINTQNPVNGAFSLPTRTAQMKYYKDHPTDYKEVVVGGLRIAKITDFTNATTIAKTRKFTYMGLGGVSTGKQLRPPVKYVYGYPEILRIQDEASIASTGQGWSAFCPVKSWGIEMNAFSLSPLGSSGTGNVIGYDQVSVSEVDGSNRPNGYRVFQYHNEKDTFPSSLLFADIPSTPDLANGMLIHETFLDKDKNIIEETINGISPKASQSSTYQGMMFLVGGNLTGTALQLAKAYYQIPAQFWFNASETKRVYNGVNYLETVSTNAYGSSFHNLLTQQTVVDSKGNTLATQNAYPADRVASGNDPTGVYALMVNKHLINPVIETKMLFNNFQYARKLVNYASWNTNAFFAPLSVQTQVKTADPLITQVSFLTYDTRANLTKYSLRNGQTTALTWYGTTLAEKGKTDLLKTQTVGGGSMGTVLSRTMSYDYKPLVGLLTATDLNGYTLTNAYDKFSRLISVKDPQNFLLKDINYHYANESTLTGLGLTPTNTLNYIISRVAREAQTGSKLTSQIDSTTTQIAYMDGLGRDLQAQIWKGSPDKLKDIITATTVFDIYGRNHKNILPTPSDGILGEYKSTALTLANAFYGDTCAYTQTVFEPSPLNRPIKQFGAGQAWKATNNQKFVAMAYELQGGGIGRFDIQADGSVKWTNSYPLSSLYSYKTTSERGSVTYELKDKLGRVTHKFQQMETGFAITAYCYNDLGQLAYVISPEAYKKMGLTTAGLIENFTENDVIFKELCFGYHYDGLGRLSEKHVPGAGWTYMVYDKNDRVVLQADEADLAKGYWSFKKYDALSRIVQSGTVHGFASTSRTTIQAAFDGHSANLYEDRGTAFYGYTNVSFPSAYAPVDTNFKIVMYYDDYLWNTDVAYNFQASNAFHAQGLSMGILTGMLVRNLETRDWYKFTNYVDYKGRIIQQFSQNHVGGIDRMDYQYRFNNEVLKMRMTHKKSGALDLVELYQYSYDHAGRKTSFTHNNKVVAKYEYDGISRLKNKKFSPAGTALTSSRTGNWHNTSTWQSGVLPLANDNVTINTGQIITIPNGEIGSAGTLNDRGTLNNFGTLNMGKYTTSDLYNQSISYHIRGGIRGYNLDNEGNLTNTLFSFKLEYEGNNGFFDGNIRNQYWKSNIDGIQRAYEYNYDVASRLISGAYGSTKAGEDYSLNGVTYDFNGNITTLSRNGYKSNNTFGLVDNLGYAYQANSNKIQSVSDNSGETASFTDATGATDYTYYPDGSLKSDANKGVTLIEYNYLKLPRKVVQNGITTLFQYDASGKKLKETIGSNFTDYSGNKIYKNSALYQIGHDEGRIVDGQYEYFINDHLGNLRVSFRDSSGIAKISQKQDYDPYGAELQKISYLKNSWKQSDFKYSGKEFIEQTELNDYGWRQQDPIIGRMWGIDRFSEKYYGLSPMQFAGNNPITTIEVNGDSLVINYFDANSQAQRVYYDYTQQGGYGFYNADGTAYTGSDKFINQVGSALAQLGLGKEGRQMIDFLSNDAQIVAIGLGKNTYDDATNTVGFNPNSNTDIPTEGGTNGMAKAPTFISLGHELAHSEDHLKGTLNRNTTWNGYEEAEKYSTHRENQFRGENGLPLRTTYGVDISTGIKRPDPNSAIIDSKGYSLFFKLIKYRK